jgi:hypothetical protein
VKRGGAAQGGWAAALAALALLTPPASYAEPQTPAVQVQAASTPDDQTAAVLLGAAFAKSELSADHPMGMMFLPGRGLVRWETWGKTLAEQEELKTEAIGLADARAVQAEIDARQGALDRDHEDRERRSFAAAAARSGAGLDVAAVTGTERQAGAIAPLNRAARSQIADALGMHDGAGFKNRGRVYLFGAVSGRGVGMNLLHDTDGGWRNAGLSTDKGGFVGQRQAGLAFRKGQTQAAISYVREKSRVQVLGITDIKDHRAMLNITFTPKVAP